jgi:hypothetical protein
MRNCTFCTISLPFFYRFEIQPLITNHLQLAPKKTVKFCRQATHPISHLPSTFQKTLKFLQAGTPDLGFANMSPLSYKIGFGLLADTDSAASVL